MARFETMAIPSARLVNILIGKSIIETLVVGALAVFTFMSVLPPYFRGSAEATTTGVSGWAVNHASSAERVEVQLFVDGRFVAQGTADQRRPDVSAAGWAQDDFHGFEFPLSLPATDRSQTHEARVYILHDDGRGVRKSLQLLGSPIPLAIGEDGKLIPFKVSQ